MASLTPALASRSPGTHTSNALRQTRLSQGKPEGRSEEAAAGGGRRRGLAWHPFKTRHQVTSKWPRWSISVGCRAEGSRWGQLGSPSWPLQGKPRKPSALQGTHLSAYSPSAPAPRPSCLLRKLPRLASPRPGPPSSSGPQDGADSVKAGMGLREAGKVHGAGKEEEAGPEGKCRPVRGSCPRRGVGSKSRPSPF